MSFSFVERSFHLVLVNLITIIGFLILIFVDGQHAHILYIGGILTTVGLYSNVSIKVAWMNNNLYVRMFINILLLKFFSFSASLTRRAVALAFAISIGAFGGLISGQIYDETQKPRYIRGHAIGLICTILQTILIIVLRLILMFINQQRATINEEEIEQYNGDQLAGDRHPRFRYTL